LVDVWSGWPESGPGFGACPARRLAGLLALARGGWKSWRARVVVGHEVGPVEIDTPRDRDGTFEPATVKKRQRRLNGVDSMVISLTAKGLTTGEVEAYLAEVYGTEISRETILEDHRCGS